MREYAYDRISLEGGARGIWEEAEGALFAAAVVVSMAFSTMALATIETSLLLGLLDSLQSAGAASQVFSSTSCEE